MKKLLSIMFAVSILLVSFSACVNIPEQETTTQPETTTAVQEQKDIDKSASEKSYKTLIIENEKYRFTIQKTDFEKNYSEETLMEISELVPMEFGYDDYYNWNGSPNEVINDVLLCLRNSRNNWFFERFPNESAEWKSAEAEIETYEYEVWDDYVITDIKSINEFLSYRFGPQARQFKPEDFDTYEEVVTENGRITEGFELLSYRYVYLPKSELVVCYMSETTGFGVPAAYIYDIQTVDGEYVVKAVSGSDNYLENYDTFEGLQNDTLKIMRQYTSERLTDYTMIIACDDNGKLYMQSVKSRNILSENIKCNYKVVSGGETVNVECRRLFSKGMETVGTLKNGEEVYVGDMTLSEKRLVITEDFWGWVDEKYLIRNE